MITGAEAAPRYSKSFKLFLNDIKLKHSIFALPFAAVAFLVGNVSFPNAAQTALLIVCMVSARSWAMGVNRLLDRKIDKRNPRTATRAMAAGALGARHATVILVVFATIFVTSAFALNQVVGFLSVPLLVVLALYSLLKRVSWLCHYYLGICLGLAPVAVSLAIKGTVETSVLMVAGAITFWTAGFDILYSLQDQSIDRKERLHSIPARFGSRAARLVSRVNFVLALLALLSVGVQLGFGVFYYLGLVLVSYLLLYQHILLGWDTQEPPRLDNINKAFFDSNALVSLVYFSFTLIDRLCS